MADDDFGNELKTITNETDDVQRSNAFEELYFAQYSHMLKRMKKDLIACQLKSNDLVGSLHWKNLIYQ